MDIAVLGIDLGKNSPQRRAHDLKTSLAELMQDLQRARAANFSPRSFAPPANYTQRVAAEAFRFSAH